MIKGHIIKQLDKNILTEWDFTYDGSFWVHKNYPFKLKMGKNNIYQAYWNKEDLKPKDVPNTAVLMQYILAVANKFILEGLKHKPEKIDVSDWFSKLMLSFFKFDENLMFEASLTKEGNINFKPDNCYTYTLMSGVEFKFTVGVSNDRSEEIYCNPLCVNYDNLKELLESDDIIYVNIWDSEEMNSSPFFGVGYKFS